MSHADSDSERYDDISIDDLFQHLDSIMLLKLYVEEGFNELRTKYKDLIINHNKKICSSEYPDAGFDLLVAEDQEFFHDAMVNKLNSHVKCSAVLLWDDDRCFNTGFYLHARSSTGTKTPLRLANQVGIIDSGYRGPIIGAFDCIRKKEKEKEDECDFFVSKYDKLLQICAPGLVPVFVILVETESELGNTTVRGEGGFGSTGK